MKQHIQLCSSAVASNKNVGQSAQMKSQTSSKSKPTSNFDTTVHHKSSSITEDKKWDGQYEVIDASVVVDKKTYRREKNTLKK